MLFGHGSVGMAAYSVPMLPKLGYKRFVLA
jgi:hypothetical protein